MLLIANDKLSTAEQKLQNHVEENECLASSNNRLKEVVEKMAEQQAVLREKHDTKEELRTIGKELVRLRKQLKKQELLMSEMQQNFENLRSEMTSLAAGREEVWWQQLGEEEGKVERLEREVAGRRREVEEYVDKVGTMEADRERSVWNGLGNGNLISLDLKIIYLFCG